MIIATHDGEFHADEVFAISCRTLVHPEARIIRTRAQELINKADEVYDIGEEYDPESNKFDHHHLKGPNCPYHPEGIRLASFGMCWEKYGKETIFNVINSEELGKIKNIYEKIRSSLVLTVDSLDNGKYICENFAVTISHIISSFNPNWNSDYDENVCFNQAVEFAEQVLLREIYKYEASFDAYRIIKDSYCSRSDSKILVLNQFIPWQEWLFDIEENQEIHFVVFPDKNKLEWRCQCVPTKKGKFDQRTPFPREWAGKRNMELEETSKIEGAVFCHINKFISGWKSKESAILAAKVAMNVK